MTNSQPFKDILDAMGKALGHLDNTSEKWVATDDLLQTFNVHIKQSLEESFPPDSFPISVFKRNMQTYQELLEGLRKADQPKEIVQAGTGYLNLRMFILLQAFLMAAHEALEKHRLNEGIEPAQAVEKSYYAPFFFERLPITTKEVIAMLENDLSQLASFSRDKTGALAAIRIKKGTCATLLESYCPTRPLLYYHVRQLETIKPRASGEVVDEVATCLESILAKIRKIEPE